jgi:hypothetical protein
MRWRHGLCPVTHGSECAGNDVLYTGELLRFMLNNWLQQCPTHCRKVCACQLRARMPPLSAIKTKSQMQPALRDPRELVFKL